jgi:uncharacterized protein (TIGR02145 family)
MRLSDNSPTVSLEVVSAATNSTVIYVGEVQDLDITLSNRTGNEIKFVSKGDASYFEIVLPAFYTTAEIAVMTITDLKGWTCKATDYTLVLTIGPDAVQTWESGTVLKFTIKGAQTTTMADPDAIAVNFYNMAGDNIPFGQQVTLTPAAPPVHGKVDLAPLLDISLDNQGIVFVSPDYDDPLSNTLYLNIKNKSADKLFTGSPNSGKNLNASIIVSFVSGNTAGALAPKPNVEQIKCEAYVKPAQYDWGVQRPDGSVSSWKLSPANTNVGLLGPGEDANVSFKLSEIVTANPVGYTQIILKFTGFSKDDTTDYNDFVYILDVSKQAPPPTRGLLNFYSRQALFTVTAPGQPVSFQLEWSMFFVDKITLMTSYMGSMPHTQQYTAGTALGYDQHTITIPSVAQSTPVFVTLQAYDANDGFLNALQFSIFIQNTAFVDPRDHQVYPTVLIGQQIWLAKNLDYVADGQSFVLSNSPGNEARYGRLYYREFATQNLPGGWRLPTLDDWNKLLQYFGSAEKAYAALNSKGDSGFNAQTGGYMDNLKGFTDDGNGYYWTSSEQDANDLCYAKLDSGFGKLNLLNTFPPGYALSIRYVKDL